jgi:hypothetical protein
MAHLSQTTTTFSMKQQQRYRLLLGCASERGNLFLLNSLVSLNFMTEWKNFAASQSISAQLIFIRFNGFQKLSIGSPRYLHSHLLLKKSVKKFSLYFEKLICRGESFQFWFLF